MSKDERLDFLIMAHDALGAAGECGEEQGRFLKTVLKATADAAGSDRDGVSKSIKGEGMRWKQHSVAEKT